MEIENRVIIVTGASSGIGLATAKALAKRGAKVVLIARSTEALTRISAQLPGSIAVTADMTDFDGVRSAVRNIHSHFGSIHGLINNAGRSYAARVEDIDPVIFDEIFHVNVLGPIVAMQSVIPIMRAQGGGNIVNVNSGTAFKAIPQYSVYSASKRALVGFSLTARMELEKDNIVVSEVYPYITDTNLGSNQTGSLSDGTKEVNYAAGDTPEFVANLILQAFTEGEAQYFANDQIKKRAGAE